jgi:rRNA maturation RNase YbeY
VVKNLQVNIRGKAVLEKISIHKLVHFLKSELKFDISSLPVNFIHSDQITGINQDYLKHYYSTDIITFNYTGDHKLLDGELYISIEDADYNAKKFRVSKKDEYLRLVIHGILHLLDYDDLDKNDKLVMKKLESRLLNKFVNQSKNKRN